MNAKVLLLVVGLVAGAVIGWVTKPPAASLQLGPVNIEIASNQSIGGEGNGPTNGQWYYIGMITAVGGLLGLGLGVLLDSGRRT